MKYLLGFSILKDDPKRNDKLVVASLLAFSAAVIPILGQVVLSGWQALAMRKAARGDHGPLPRLDFDFQYLVKLFELGFKAFIVRFIWQMPAMVLVLTLVGCIVGGTLTSVVEPQMREDEIVGLAVAITLGAMIVVTPISMLLMIPSAVAGMRTELSNDLNAGLKVAEVLGFTRNNFGPLLIGTIVVGLVSSALSLVGLLACYVGVFPVMVASMIAHAYLMGQIYRRHVERGGEPLEIGPDEIGPDETGTGDDERTGTAPPVAPSEKPDAAGW